MSMVNNLNVKRLARQDSWVGLVVTVVVYEFEMGVRTLAGFESTTTARVVYVLKNMLDYKN